MNTSSTGSNRVLRGAGVIIGIVGILLIIGLIAAHLIIDASFVEERANPVLDRETDGLYRIEIGSVRPSLFLQSFELEDVFLHTDSSAIERRRTNNDLPATRYEIGESTLSLNNINYLRLLWREEAVLDSLVLRRPELTITTSATQDTSARSDTATESFATRINESLPFVATDRLRISDGSITMEGEQTGQVNGISIQFDDLQIDSTALQDTSRLLFSRNVELSIGSIRRGLIDSLYSLELDSLHGTSRDRSMHVSSFTVEPTLPDSIFLRRLPERDPRYDVDIGPITMEAVDYRALVERQAVDIRAITVNSMVFDLYLDRRVPEVPEPPPPMPQDLIEAVDFPLTVDTLNIRKGTIRYTLGLEDTHRDAELTFDLVPSHITNITNNPERMSPSNPAIVRAGAYLNGTGPLYTTMAIPLLTPSLSMEFSGEMSELDPQALNDVLFPMRSTRITGGEVDSVWFHATVENDMASGEFRAVYRDLDLELADQETGEQGLTDNIKSFILNEAMLKSSNIPSEDDPLRVGTIEHERNEDNSFFKFLWKSVQSGVYSLIGL